MHKPAVCDPGRRGASAQTAKPGGFPARQHPSGGTATIVCTAGELATHVCTYAWLTQMCTQLRAFWEVFLFFARRK